MKLFARQPAPANVTLLNAWCSPFDDMMQVGAMRDFVDALLAFVAPAAIASEINFGSARSIAGLLRGLGTMRSRDVESLIVSDERGAGVLNIVLITSSLGSAPPVFNVLAVFPCGAPAADEMLDVLAAYRIHYAYIRELSGEFSPQSETRIRRSLFGGVSVKVDGSFNHWLVPDRDVRGGAVRGIYPVNVLSDVALQRLAATGLGLPASLPRRGGTVWRLSAEDKAELLRRNPSRGDVLHLDES